MFPVPRPQLVTRLFLRAPLIPWNTQPDGPHLCSSQGTSEKKREEKQTADGKMEKVLDDVTIG